MRKWSPDPGTMATYAGRHGVLLKSAGLVKIIAEASGQRRIVEAVRGDGSRVRCVVRTANLVRPQPQLF